MSSPPAWVAWTSITLLWAAAARAAYFAHLARRSHREQQDLMWWEKATAIVVTDQDGSVFASTIAQLRRVPDACSTWVSPVMVSIWQTDHHDPATHTPDKA